MKVTIETDSPEEAQQMISAIHISADLEDFNQYLRSLLKHSEKDTSILEGVHEVFWQRLGKYIE